MSSQIVTRFAPSPTGFLHIGGARTALFNMLYARHSGGKYLLRIEDTDRKRSSPEAIDAILEGLDWLGLSPDEEPVFQSKNLERHSAIARQLLEEGKAYYCYCTPEELTEMRETARAEGRSPRYDGRWRDRDAADAPKDVPPVIRFKAPLDGETVIGDLVQGEVRVENTQLDDMILLRADGTPTYMLSVVVDDHDMGITHAIRGDDHLTNAFRQTQLFSALGWEMPVYAHIPLIHGPDGTKMSKRHGALGVEAYRDMGYLPEALLNYLMRLGWSHGDDEIISLDQAIEWFDIADVNKGAARFDFDKLGALNGHYINTADDERLISLIGGESPVGEGAKERLKKGLPGLRDRAKTISELTEKASLYIINRPIEIDAKAGKLLTPEALDILNKLTPRLSALPEWNEESIEAEIRAFIEDQELKLGNVAQPLRAALCGTTTSPGIFEVVYALGREEALGRLADAIN